MTDRDRQEFLAYIEEFGKKIKGNRELSIAFLNRAGICTKEGKLTEPYMEMIRSRTVEID